MAPLFSLLVLKALFARPVARRPWRFIITVLGVATGVASILATMTATRAAVSSLSEGIEEVAGRARLEITQSGGMQESFLSKLRPLARDAVIAPVVEEFAMVPKLKDTIRVLGVDFFIDTQIRSFGAELKGNFSEEILNQALRGEGALVPERLAKELDISIGQKLTILSRSKPVDVAVLGLLRPSKLTSAWNRTILTDINYAQEIFGKNGRVDRIDLLPRGKLTTAQLQQNAKGYLEPGMRLEEPRTRGEQAANMVRALEFNLTALSGISLIVGAVLVATMLATSVVQRRPILALLRSLGATNRQIIAVILFEAFVIGLLGGVVGILGGYGGAQAAIANIRSTISVVVQGVPSSEIELPPTAIPLGLGVGILVSLIAAILPLREALRTPPIQGLRRERPKLLSSRSWMRASAAAVILLISSFVFSQLPPVGDLPYAALLSILALFVCVLVISSPALDAATRFIAKFDKSFGLILRMASAALSAGRTRAAWAAGAVGMAVALAIAITTMVGSFRTTVTDFLNQTIQSDVWIRPATAATGVHVGRLDPEIVNIALQQFGPDVVDPFHETWAFIGNKPVAVCGGEYRVVLRGAGLPFRDGRDPADVFREAIKNNTILINEPLANRFHVREGDLLKLTVPGGFFERRVEGVFYDYSRSEGMMVMDRSDYLSVFPDDGPKDMSLFLNPGESPEAARAKMIELLGGRFRVDILLNREIRSEGMRAFERTFEITRVLELVSRIVSIVAVITVLSALVDERRHDFALVRAVGGAKLQIIGTVVWQGAILGFVSIAGGILFGILGGIVLVKVVNLQSFGWTMRFALPWGDIASVASAVITTCVGAALVPAWLASRGTPRELLREDS
ncbi:MAG: FtsX-like permease family protein [Planctomycetota bacterium]